MPPVRHHAKVHGIVLLSGGLDSTTVAAHALRAGWNVRGLCIRYGQRHEREVEAALAVAGRLGIPCQVADARFYGDLAAYSALTSDMPLPPTRDAAAMAAAIPNTYVPLRNTFFVTAAAAALESWMLGLIDGGREAASLRPAVFVGANAVDYSGYPDCRPEFYDALTEVLRLGSKLGMQHGVRITIEAPIIRMSKAEIARYADELGAPTDLTWSCYAGGDAPCGTCDSCILRANGFREAGLADPALVPRP